MTMSNRKLLFVGCLMSNLLIAGVGHAIELNFGDIKQMTRELIRDTDEPYRFSDVKISSYVNIGQSEISMLTWPLVGVKEYTIEPGRKKYAFDSDMVVMQRLTVDNALLPATSIEELDRNGSDWEVNMSTGRAENYYVNHTTFSYIGFDVFIDTNDYTSFTAYYTKMPDDMVSNTDVPFDSMARLRPYHFALVLWTASILSIQAGNKDNYSLYYSMYVDRMKLMEPTIRLTPDYFPNMFGDRNKR